MCLGCRPSRTTRHQGSPCKYGVLNFCRSMLCLVVEYLNCNVKPKDKFSIVNSNSTSRSHWYSQLQSNVLAFTQYSFFPRILRTWNLLSPSVCCLCQKPEPILLRLCALYYQSVKSSQATLLNHLSDIVFQKFSDFFFFSCNNDNCMCNISLCNWPRNERLRSKLEKKSGQPSAFRNGNVVFIFIWKLNPKTIFFMCF